MAPPMNMGPSVHPSMREVTEDTPPDLLEGTMDLLVVLPSKKTVRMTVNRRTPMMDLLIQVATANKIVPGGHIVQVRNERGFELPYKPSTPIGALDTTTIEIVPKNQVNEYIIVKKQTAKLANQPFEQTFRLQVHLPRNQLYVMRVGQKTLLADILQEVCQEKNLDYAKYEIRHPVKLDEKLSLDCRIGDFGLQELTVVSRNSRINSSVSTADILALQHEEGRSKGLDSAFKHSRSSVGDSSVSSESVASARGTSPSRSDDSRSISPLPPIRPKLKLSTTMSNASSSSGISSALPKSQLFRNDNNSMMRVTASANETGPPVKAPPRNKKRAAPQPPSLVLPTKSNTSSSTPSSTNTNTLQSPVAAPGGNNSFRDVIPVSSSTPIKPIPRKKEPPKEPPKIITPLSSHSRHNSDSSGYHDSYDQHDGPPKYDRQQSVPVIEGNLVQQRMSASLSVSNLTSVPSVSTTSLASSNGGYRKRKAPKPPAAPLLQAQKEAEEESHASSASVTSSTITSGTNSENSSLNNHTEVEVDPPGRRPLVSVSGVSSPKSPEKYLTSKSRSSSIEEIEVEVDVHQESPVREITVNLQEDKHVVDEEVESVLRHYDSVLEGKDLPKEGTDYVDLPVDDGASPSGTESSLSSAIDSPETSTSSSPVPPVVVEAREETPSHSKAGGSVKTVVESSVIADKVDTRLVDVKPCGNPNVPVAIATKQESSSLVDCSGLPKSAQAAALTSLPVTTSRMASVPPPRVKPRTKSAPVIPETVAPPTRTEPSEPVTSVRLRSTAPPAPHQGQPSRLSVPEPAKPTPRPRSKKFEDEFQLGLEQITGSSDDKTAERVIIRPGIGIKVLPDNALAARLARLSRQEKVEEIGEHDYASLPPKNISAPSPPVHEYSKTLPVRKPVKPIAPRGAVPAASSLHVPSSAHSSENLSAKHVTNALSEQDQNQVEERGKRKLIPYRRSERSSESDNLEENLEIFDKPVGAASGESVNKSTKRVIGRKVKRAAPPPPGAVLNKEVRSEQGRGSNGSISSGSSSSENSRSQSPNGTITSSSTPSRTTNLGPSPGNNKDSSSSNYLFGRPTSDRLLAGTKTIKRSDRMQIDTSQGSLNRWQNYESLHNAVSPVKDKSSVSSLNRKLSEVFTNVPGSADSQDETALTSSESEASCTDSGLPPTATVTPSPIDGELGNMDKNMSSLESSRRSSMDSVDDLEDEAALRKVIESKVDDKKLEIAFDGIEVATEESPKAANIHLVAPAAPASSNSSPSPQPPTDGSTDEDESRIKSSPKTKSSVSPPVFAQEAPESRKTTPPRKLSKSESFSHKSEFDMAKMKRRLFTKEGKSSSTSASQLKKSYVSSSDEDLAATSGGGRFFASKLAGGESKSLGVVEGGGSMQNLSSGNNVSSSNKDHSGGNRMELRVTKKMGHSRRFGGPGNSHRDGPRKATSVMNMQELDPDLAQDPVLMESFRNEFKQWKEQFLQKHLGRSRSGSSDSNSERSDKEVTKSVDGVQAVRVDNDKALEKPVVQKEVIETKALEEVQKEDVVAAVPVPEVKAEPENKQVETVKVKPVTPEPEVRVATPEVKAVVTEPEIKTEVQGSAASPEPAQRPFTPEPEVSVEPEIKQEVQIPEPETKVVEPVPEVVAIQTLQEEDDAEKPQIVSSVLKEAKIIVAQPEAAKELWRQSSSSESGTDQEEVELRHRERNKPLQEKGVVSPMEAQPEEQKIYRYSGPPTIQMGTWGDRPQRSVSVKRDRDYKMGMGQHDPKSTEVKPALVSVASRVHSFLGGPISNPSTVGTKPAGVAAPPVRPKSMAIANYMNALTSNSSSGDSGGMGSRTTSVPSLPNVVSSWKMKLQETEKQRGTLTKQSSHGSSFDIVEVDSKIILDEVEPVQSEKVSFTLKKTESFGPSPPPLTIGSYAESKKVNKLPSSGFNSSGSKSVDDGDSASDYSSSSSRPASSLSHTASVASSTNITVSSMSDSTSSSPIPSFNGGPSSLFEKKKFFQGIKPVDTPNKETPVPAKNLKGSIATIQRVFEQRPPPQLAKSNSSVGVNSMTLPPREKPEIFGAPRPEPAAQAPRVMGYNSGGISSTAMVQQVMKAGSFNMDSVRRTPPTSNYSSLERSATASSKPVPESMSITLNSTKRGEESQRSFTLPSSRKSDETPKSSITNVGNKSIIIVGSDEPTSVRSSSTSSSSNGPFKHQLKISTDGNQSNGPSSVKINVNGAYDGRPMGATKEIAIVEKASAPVKAPQATKQIVITSRTPEPVATTNKISSIAAGLTSSNSAFFNNLRQTKSVDADVSKSSAGKEVDRPVVIEQVEKSKKMAMNQASAQPSEAVSPTNSSIPPPPPPMMNVKLRPTSLNTSTKAPSSTVQTPTSPGDVRSEILDAIKNSNGNFKLKKTGSILLP